MRVLSAVVLLATVGPSGGCPMEYEVHPQWEPDLLERLDCPEEADAEAAPQERPVAVCAASAEEVLPVHESVSLFGSSSWDPQGHELVAWDWRLVERPAGSAATVPDGDADRYGFVADVVGTYVAELVVVNDQCVTSAPCQVAIDADPSEDLWVEMHWQHADDDMDLHLVEGDAALESQGDCYYGNCVGGGPDWGAPGATYDDPGLDLDDIEGTGPENVNVPLPAPGAYHVVVHDYPGSVYRGENDVTVRIYLGGERVFEETRALEGEDHYEWFATVHWPEGTVEPL